jgi:hypothetical protein
VTSHLAREGETVQASDLPLALDPRRVLGREVADQGAEPLADLEREVRGGGSHQLAHVVNCDLAARAQAIGVLSAAHFWGTASSSESTWACTATEIAFVSPMIQPWL